MAIHARDTKIETMHIVQPGDLNAANVLFGGRLMEWMDEAAALSAMHYCQGHVVTGTVDSLVFYKGASQGDVIVICAQVTYKTKSTCEIRVRVHVQHVNGSLDLINKGYFVMVVVPDKAGKRPDIPELITDTQEERIEWENGEIRNRIRKERRQGGI